MAPRQRAAAFARHYLLAVQFFTRLPVTGPLAEWVGYSPERLRASAAHFPGVGWLVGLAACAAFALFAFALPATPFTHFVAAVAATACTVLLTGAFHEDGLADLADGLGGSLDRERALEIMKDSRIGTFGAIALVLALLTKVGLLAVLAAASPASVFPALLAAHVVSRFWPLLIVRTLPYVADLAGSKSKPLADRISSQALAVAAAWCVVPLAIAALAQGLPFVASALAASGVAFALMRQWLARRLAGFTGDALGATQQACELAFYLGAALALAGPR
ncbi:adenosylcobinamide-GDP ribazoletransferase [Ramlibacter humi]|uniref:Adenosylcobinamide-GDP ribazoletransferase n=1 Tax=Ramlibacter humi TaxID=2530451 RepID=A0A4Z0BZ37_9BURK|nr:adenosylcobinamide-GDP ribazoletransferase [Ramlibacter humi]TFZ03550.1 adenosylcobinamide-GDP ribazoletransferase [Ramlibacter humi]